MMLISFLKSKIRLTSFSFKNILIILIFSLIPTFSLWLPFFLRLEKIWGIPLPKRGMESVVANYDGPLFIVVAKTFYKKELISNFPLTLPSEYYAAHFPLYPVLIRLISPITGYPYAMLSVTLISSILSLYFFQKLISEYVNKGSLFFLTLVFSILPARWLIVRSVGSAEPLFIACIIASLYYFKKRSYLKASFWGVVASITKSPGILLFPAFIISWFFLRAKEMINDKNMVLFSFKDFKKISSILLIPLALILVFVFFKIRMNDFFAYFHSGDNIHLVFPPFRIFDYSSTWVGTFWLEEILFVYLFAVIGIYRLFEKREYEYAIFSLIFFISLLFVSHRDLIRYGLPLVPFLYVAFSEIIVKREFKLAITILIIPIYLFSLVYISQNVMPISDWSPLL